VFLATITPTGEVIRHAATKQRFFTFAGWCHWELEISLDFWSYFARQMLYTSNQFLCWGI
jgi:hypothetical protein